jgi:hypothetical protein
MVKLCAWGTCNSDYRYPERLVNEVGGTTCTKDGFICTKDSYVCSLHFVDKKGPTEEYPYPISATASRDTVSIWSMDKKLNFYANVYI